MSEDEKPKLGLRPQLGVKRTTEVSQVKQSFSHGRTHKVVVETKKARVFRKPGDPVPASAEDEQAFLSDDVLVEDAPAPVPAPAAPVVVGRVADCARASRPKALGQPGR